MHETRIQVESFGCRSTVNFEGKELKAAETEGNTSEYIIKVENKETVFEVKWK